MRFKKKRSSNLAKTNAKVTLNGVKNINGFTAVYSDRTDRAFQLQYDSGSLISHNNHLNVLAYKTSALICPEVLTILDAVSLRTYTLVV